MDDVYNIKVCYVVPYAALLTETIFFNKTAGLIFVPESYHEKRTKKFLKDLSNVGQYGPDNARCEFPEIGRKYYIYKKNNYWFIS